MNLPCPSDASLYELATRVEQSPPPLQMSPTTFKSMVGIFFDFLVEKNLSSTIWLKLPRGDVWQQQVEQFCQLATAPYTIYSLHTYHAEEGLLDLPGRVVSSPPSARSSSGTSSAGSDLGADPDLTGNWDKSQSGTLDLNEVALVNDWVEPSDSGMMGSKVYPLPIAPDSQLKREYFLLVVSPEFYGLIVAHRPRSSVRSLKISNTPQESPSSTSKSSLFAEDPLDQKHPLLGLCSFDLNVIKPVLEEGINRAICFGQPLNKSSAELEKLLITWEDLQQKQMARALNPLLMGELLVKQVQRQEEFWRSGTSYRRQAEMASILQRENEELLSTLRAKDEFAKIVGQELRTPLTSMKTALSLLNSPSLKPQQRQRYMDMLSHECDRQSSLITSVLDLVQLESTVEQVPMEALRLSEIVPGVVSTYQPLAQEKGVMLGYTIPEDLPPISCLNPWLRQIVINLLHNSIKFTPQGGQVWVRARQQGESILVEFRDTGIGIPLSEIPKIFDRFYRIRHGSGEDTSGAGLGLSIVQQLLLRCGGSISVKSKQGEGSVFSVILPVYEKRSEE